MGWFNWLVDDVLGIDLGPSEQQKIDAAHAREREQLASDAALKAQQDASKMAAAAALGASNDSESARAAADDRRRKLMMGSSFGIGMPTQLGAPPVGFRLLSGQ